MSKRNTDDDASPNSSALEEIELLSPKETGALERILTLSNGCDEEVWVRAIEKFVEFSEADVHDRTIEALQDPDLFVRIEALESLGFWGRKSDLGAVAKCLEDEEDLIRCAAVDALGNIGDKDVLRILEQRWVSAKERECVSIFAAIRQIDSSNQDALWSLLGLLRSSDYRVRSAAANSVDKKLHISNDLPEVERHLDAALMHEETAAVRSSLRAAKKRISHSPGRWQN